MMKQHAAQPQERFICEPIVPDADSLSATAMARGEPSLPGRFRWRETEYTVHRVIETWKSYSPCSEGSSERYVRKHWYRVETTDGKLMKLYFERHPRPGQAKKRWWLATVIDPETTPGPPPHSAG